jgi:hypothetical protein
MAHNRSVLCLLLPPLFILFGLLIRIEYAQGQTAVDPAVIYAGPATGCTMSDLIWDHKKCWSPNILARLSREVFLLTIIGPDVDGGLVSNDKCGTFGYYLSPINTWSPEIKLSHSYTGAEFQECTFVYGVIDPIKATTNDNIVFHNDSKDFLGNMESCGLEDRELTILPGKEDLSSFSYSRMGFLYSGRDFFEDRPCILTFSVVRSSGNVGLDVSWTGDSNTCSGVKSDGFYTVAGLPPTPPLGSTVAAHTALVPRPITSLQFQIVMFYMQLPPTTGCYLKLRLIAKPFVRFLNSRLTIAKKMLTDIQPAHSLEARTAAGNISETESQIASAKQDFLSKIATANAEMETGKFADVLKLLWDIGKFVAGHREGFAGPLLLGDLLLDHENQKPSPLERAYDEGLLDPDTHGIYGLNRQELQDLKEAYEGAIASVNKLPPYETNTEAVKALQTILDNINYAIYLQEHGVSRDEATTRYWNNRILESKPIDIDPGTIDRFDKNREWISRTA